MTTTMTNLTTYVDNNIDAIMTSMFRGEHGDKVILYVGDDNEVRHAVLKAGTTQPDSITIHECVGLNNRDTSDYLIDGEITDESCNFWIADNKAEIQDKITEIIDNNISL